MTLIRSARRNLAVCLFVLAALCGGAGSVVLGICGPFTDISDAGFCPFVLEIFTLGITTGTTPTTYDPAANVTRLQMAAFLSRSVDGVLKRGSRRAALNRFWTPQNDTVIGLTSVGIVPALIASDGADLWAGVSPANVVVRVRGSDGKLLETWTGATGAYGVLSAIGQIFVTGQTSPGTLYRIDPTLPAGSVSTVALNLGSMPQSIAFDGSRIWTANITGSVSIATPGGFPFAVTTVTTGFLSPGGVLFDGSNIWVTDYSAGSLLKLDGAGAILQTVSTAGLYGGNFPVFDGSNIWVPGYNSNSVVVVRASNGAVLATLTGNGLFTPRTAAFDGERVAISNGGVSNGSLSLWRAADLKALGNFEFPGSTFGTCSDGVNFWVTLGGPPKIARF